MDKENWPLEAQRLFKLATRLLIALGEDEFDVGPGKVGGRNYRDRLIMVTSYHYGPPDDDPTILKIFAFTPCRVVFQNDGANLMNYEPAVVNKLIAHIENLIPLDSMGMS